MGKRTAANPERGLPSASPCERPERATHPKLLLIGYGNQLRSDDGIGAKAAAIVEEWNLPHVCTIICHQLTPELAEPISSARRVVFVDASMDRAHTSVELNRIKPKPAAQITAHAADPHSLLGLAKGLFGRVPSAYWLTIPIENTAFGEELSPKAQRGLQLALKKIRNVIAR